jgi:sec-independent protein translocase protein TatA
MGSMSIWHWIVVIAVVLLLFGRGKISELMGDVAQGIKSFKKGMSEDETAKTEPPKTDPKTIDHQPVQATSAQASTPTPGLQQQSQTERKFEGSAG